MDDDTFISGNLNITKKAVRKWAQDWSRRFADLRRSLEKAGDDFDDVLKGLDVNAPTFRLFRNQARKIKREAATAARARREVLKLVDRELKRYAKVVDNLDPKD
jgi:hypothetical protein